MSKYLQIPETVTLKDLLTDKAIMVQNPDDLDNPVEVTITFSTFVVGTLLKDPAFGANAVTVMQAIDLKDQLKAGTAGEWIEIEDETAGLLKQVIDQPANPFNPEIMMQLGSFLKSILKVSDSKPE